MQSLLEFARLHDWGHDAELVESGVRIGYDLPHPDGRWTREYSVFTNMRDLREFAGY